jgi:hypothetical protein
MLQVEGKGKEGKEKVCALRAFENNQEACKVLIQVKGTQKLGRSQENEKNPAALGTGGAQRVIIGTLRAWIGSWHNPYGKCRFRKVLYKNYNR